mgnify:CR=1 FL=1
MEFVQFAKYLTGFKRKKLCDQDSIILDWYRFAEAMRFGHRQIWYCLPYDGTWCTDMGGVLNAAQTHKLCTTKRLSSVLNIDLKGLMTKNHIFTYDIIQRND